MERGIVADISLVHAWKADTEGNLIYRKTARNFNPMMATAGKITIVQVEHLVQPASWTPMRSSPRHLCAAYRACSVTGPKRIENRTTRPKTAA